MNRRRKFLISSIHGGLGDQLYKYYAALYFSKIQKRNLILDIQSDVELKFNALVKLISPVADHFEKIPRSALIRKTLFTKINGAISGKNYPFSVQAKRILYFLFGVLDDTYLNYELMKTEQVFKKFHRLRFHKYIFSIGYFQDFAYYDLLPHLERQLPGLKPVNAYRDLKYACVHFRNGDILHTYTSRGVLNDAYYDGAALIYKDKVELVIGVSDDVKTCKEIHNIRNISMIDDSDQYDAELILRIMSFAQIRVCANSGLSLWASKLSPLDQSITIIPAKMDKTLSYNPIRSIPKNWLTIENGFL
jgi:hypothetical protein